DRLDLFDFQRVSLRLLKTLPNEIASVLKGLPLHEALLIRTLLSDMNERCRSLAPFLAKLDSLDTRDEVTRAPIAPEPVRIDLRKVVVFSKRSKLEIDMRKRRMSEFEARLAYRREGVDFDRILNAHENHSGSRAILKRLFEDAGVPDPTYIFDDLS